MSPPACSSAKSLSKMKVSLCVNPHPPVTPTSPPFYLFQLKSNQRSSVASIVLRENNLNVQRAPRFLGGWHCARPQGLCLFLFVFSLSWLLPYLEPWSFCFLCLHDDSLYPPTAYACSPVLASDVIWMAFIVTHTHPLHYYQEGLFCKLLT